MEFYLFSIFGGGGHSNNKRKKKSSYQRHKRLPRDARVKGIKQFRFDAKDTPSIWDMAKDRTKDTQCTCHTRYAFAAEAEPAINVQISPRLD